MNSMTIQDITIVRVNGRYELHTPEDMTGAQLRRWKKSTGLLTRQDFDLLFDEPSIAEDLATTSAIWRQESEFLDELLHATGLYGLDLEPVDDLPLYDEEADLNYRQLFGLEEG